MIPDRSQLVREFLTGPPEDLTRFFAWVATLKPEHDDRGAFIIETRNLLRRGGDPASAIPARGGLRYVSEAFEGLLSEWRAAGSP